MISKKAENVQKTRSIIVSIFPPQLVVLFSLFCLLVLHVAALFDGDLRPLLHTDEIIDLGMNQKRSNTIMA